MIPPSRVGLLLSDTEALISWKAPVSMPFQGCKNTVQLIPYDWFM